MRTYLSAVATLTAISLLAFTSSAQADYDPFDSGQTRLTLDQSLLALLKKNDVKLSALAPARLQDSSVLFPVSGGKFDPTDSKGTIEHEGALVFEVGGRTVPVKAPQLKTTQEPSPLSARVGGSQLKLASMGRLTVSRVGFGEEVRVRSLALSTKFATRLGKKLKMKDIFKAGLPLGKSLTTAYPDTIALLGKGKVELTLDPGFAAKLGSLFVAVNPIFPAEHPGTFSLPIFGGQIAPEASQGTVETQGSLEFIQLGGGQVFWAENWLDLATKAALPEVNVQPSPPYAGKVGKVAIADLGLGTVSSDRKARTVTVTGAALNLQAATAQTFNEVFAKPQGKDGIFAAGEALGVVSFTAQGQ
jgi:hypothetical protein